MINPLSMTAKGPGAATAAAARVLVARSAAPVQRRIGAITAVRMRAGMSDKTPAMPGSDAADLARELRSFRAG